MEESRILGLLIRLAIQLAIWVIDLRVNEGFGGRLEDLEVN